MIGTVIMGAGDFAREIYEYHKYSNIKVVGFFDEFSQTNTLRSLPVYNKLDDIPGYRQQSYIAGTGNPSVNKKFLNTLSEKGLILADPLIVDSYVGETVNIDRGSIICPKSILTCDIKVGKLCVVNISCTIGHDSVLEDGVVLSPNVSLSGHTILEEEVFFGTSSLTIPKIRVSAKSVIGANSVITKNIIESGLYVGSPAVRKK